MSLPSTSETPRRKFHRTVVGTLFGLVPTFSLIDVATTSTVTVRVDNAFVRSASADRVGPPSGSRWNLSMETDSISPVVRERNVFTTSR